MARNKVAPSPGRTSPTDSVLVEIEKILNGSETESNGVDDVDSALEELENMLNEGLPEPGRMLQTKSKTVANISRQDMKRTRRTPVAFDHGRKSVLFLLLMHLMVEADYPAEFYLALFSNPKVKLPLELMTLNQRTLFTKSLLL